MLGMHPWAAAVTIIVSLALFFKHRRRMAQMAAQSWADAPMTAQNEPGGLHPGNDQLDRVLTRIEDRLTALECALDRDAPGWRGEQRTGRP